MAKSSLVIACPTTCNLHPDKIGQDKAELLRDLRAGGAGAPKFSRQGAVILGLDQPLAETSVTRHFKHYREEDSLPDHAKPVDPDKKASNLEILERIIQRGYANSHNWKPSIKDTLDAMRLHVQITGNAGDDELLKLFEQADEPESIENPDAIASEEEREEALPEPVL